VANEQDAGSTLGTGPVEAADIRNPLR